MQGHAAHVVVSRARGSNDGRALCMAATRRPLRQFSEQVACAGVSDVGRAFGLDLGRISY